MMGEHVSGWKRESSHFSRKSRSVYRDQEHELENQNKHFPNFTWVTYYLPKLGQGT